MEGILLGLQEILNLNTLLFITGGIIFGFIIGSLPGLTGNMAIALMVPVTFTMEPSNALAFLVAIYCSAIFGGSVSAILLGIPGTVSSMATVLDGYPMAKKGLAGEALGIATLSSVFGGVFSALVLMFLTPYLAEQALKFGPAEYFAVSILGLSCIAGIGGNSITKALISGGIGLIISLVGLDPQTGYQRFTFNSMNLTGGVELIPALIGIFGITSILKTIETRNNKDTVEIIPEVSNVWIGTKKCLELLPTWIRGSIIGTIIGIIPGAGTNIATFLAYDSEMKVHKDGKAFGTGVGAGVAAPEAANNGVTGGSMVPLLALGVPGNATSALFLGALMIHGLRVGPPLFTDNPEIVNGIFISFLISNLLMAPVGIFLLRYMKKILSIPERLLAGIIAAFCVTGVYALNTNTFDILVLAVFGLIGYIFSKLKVPTAPLIVAMVLGPMAERNVRQALILSNGSFSFLYDRPATLIILIVSIISLMYPILTKNLKAKQVIDSYIGDMDDED